MKINVEEKFEVTMYFDNSVELHNLIQIIRYIRSNAEVHLNGAWKETAESFLKEIGDIA